MSQSASVLILFLLIPWTLYLWGAVYFITQSTLFSPIRVWLAHESWLRTELLYCPACVGFWVGCILAFTWPFGTGFSGVFCSGLSGMAMGRLWGVLAGDSTFASERKLLDLPGDTHDQKATGEGI